MIFSALSSTSRVNTPEERPLMLFGADTAGKVRKDKNKTRQAGATVVFAMSAEDCLQEMLDAETPLVFFPQFLCTSGLYLRGRNCHVR
jgi:hypothetical protein